MYFKRVLPESIATSGFLPFGNIVKFEISAESEQVERLSKQKGSYRTALDSVTLGSPTKLTITTNELGDSKILAMALLGLDENYIVTGASVTGETITAVHDEWIPLAHQEVSSVVVTGHTLNDDYLVNSTLGMIKALSTGDIVDGSTITVNYTYASKNGKKVRGNVESIVKCQLILEGRNLATDEDVIFRAPLWSISPSGALDLLGDDFASVDLTGTLEMPTGFDEPYTIEIS
jgi:hypothetical protein